jgi:hypothetical protein
MEGYTLVQLKDYFSQPYYNQINEDTVNFLTRLGVEFELKKVKTTKRISKNILTFIVRHIILMCGGDMVAVRNVVRKYLTRGLILRTISVITKERKNKFIAELIASRFFEDRFVFCNVSGPAGITKYHPNFFDLSKKIEEIVVADNLIKRTKLQAELVLLLKNRSPD